MKNDEAREAAGRRAGCTSGSGEGGDKLVTGRVTGRMTKPVLDRLIANRGGLKGLDRKV
jgi:hypothetical protein